MKIIFSIVYKGISLIAHLLRDFFSQLITHMLLYGNNATYQSFRSYSIPYVMVARGGQLIIGKDLILNNSLIGNPIFRNEPCVLFVDRNAKLKLGNNVGMSSVTIICHKLIMIGDNVKLGRATLIYDSDSHSLKASERNSSNDLIGRNDKPVTIEDNVFIGAHSIILKGVTIGENSIVGAGSVVTKSIPANQIWAGNPAKFIRNVE